MSKIIHCAVAMHIFCMQNAFVIRSAICTSFSFMLSGNEQIQGWSLPALLCKERKLVDAICCTTLLAI